LNQLNSSVILFRDRVDAGNVLAQVIIQLGLTNPVVVGLPRGGVIVAAQVAKELRAPLDIVVSRKLGAPQQPELGIGAVASGGVTVIDKNLCQELNISDLEVSQIRTRELAELVRIEEGFRGTSHPLELRGRKVVLVDDGVATGVSAHAAVRSLKLNRPKSLIAAFPVCSPSGRKLLEAEVDQVVCTAEPGQLRSVGQWYGDFTQTSEEEVVQALQRSIC
jgi:putative phosphoribosyl transferase